MYLKEGQILGLDFPNLFKFSHLSGVLFLGFVSFAKFTEKQFLKAHTGTLEFSERLQLNLAIDALV